MESLLCARHCTEYFRSTRLILTTPYEVDTVVFPILQIRKQSSCCSYVAGMGFHPRLSDSIAHSLTKPGMLKFSPCRLGLNLLFLKWVTKKSKHLEGQIYPAVSNIWDLACPHGNLFVCRLFWVALFSPFTGCLLCTLYKRSAVNFWVLGSSWKVCVTAFALFWRRRPMFLNLTQIELSGYRLDSWHTALRFFYYHILLHPTVVLVTF